jgi:arsenate reductase
MKIEYNSPKKILFVCTGNSARSVMAEVLMNEISGDRYTAFSAGAKPSGTVNQFTIDILSKHNHPVDGLRSKSIKEFIDLDIDVVVTVCDNARESCPVWPKDTTVFHWGFEDPAKFMGNRVDKLNFFDSIYQQIKKRIEDFLTNDYI